MGACTVTTADAFPSPKSTIGPPLAGTCGERRDGHHDPVKQPVRQRAVVIGVVEETGELGEPFQIVLEVFGDIQGVFEPLAIGLAVFILGKVPGDEKMIIANNMRKACE